MTSKLSGRILAAPPTSWAVVEKKARALLRQVHPQSLLAPCKTPMEQLFEGGLREALGVEYEIAGAVSGEGGYCPTRKVIILPESTYLELLDGGGRARFTVGHEIGHAVLHGSYLRGVVNRSREPYFLPRNEVPPFQHFEKQADVFSSELLMPTPQVLALLKTGHTAHDLAAIFGASLQAAEVKETRIKRKSPQFQL